MSEPKTSFMAELDNWIQDELFDPITGVCWASISADEADEIRGPIITAIRAKVLESYRNGQAAGPLKLRQR